MGEHLIRKLRETGDTQVIVLDRNAPDHKSSYPNVIYKQLDLEKPTGEYEETINQVDAVALLAYPNKKIIENFCALAANAKNLKKILYTSTMLVYPNADYHQDEATTPAPEGDYETVKCEEENYLSEFARAAGKKLLIARMGNVYGDVKNKGVINNILISWRNKETIRISGDGSQKRDFVLVDDAAEILSRLFLVDWEESKTILNICAGTGHSLNEVMAKIEALLGAKIMREYTPAGRGKAEIVGDNHKLFSALGSDYRFVNLDEGLKIMIARYGLAISA